MSTIWRNVFSTDVASVGYDDESGELLVKWVRGNRISSYANVPLSLFDQLSKTWSVGRMLASDVKGKFPHRYVD